MWVLDFMGNSVAMADNHAQRSLAEYDVARLAAALKPSIFVEETHLELQRSGPHYEREFLKTTKSGLFQCLSKFQSIFEKTNSQRRLRVMGIGDSQPMSIIDRMKESHDLLQNCLRAHESFEVDWDVVNLGMSGDSPLLYFTQLNKLATFSPRAAAAYNRYYKRFDAQKKKILEGIRTEKPDVVFYLDTQFSSLSSEIYAPIQEKLDVKLHFSEIFGDALIQIIAELARSGTRFVFLFTGAPAHKDMRSSFEKTLVVFNYVLDALEENPSRLSLQNDLTLQIFHWHKLICPEFNESTVTCSAEQYGFHRILPDSTHAEGMPGLDCFLRTIYVQIYSLTLNRYMCAMKLT